jgi:hypothetical protein
MSSERGMQNGGAKPQGEVATNPEDQKYEEKKAEVVEYDLYDHHSQDRMEEDTPGHQRRRRSSSG